MNLEKVEDTTVASAYEYFNDSNIEIIEGDTEMIQKDTDEKFPNTFNLVEFISEDNGIRIRRFKDIHDVSSDWKKWNCWVLDEEEIKLVAEKENFDWNIVKKFTDGIARRFKKLVQNEMQFWADLLKDCVQDIMKEEGIEKIKCPNCLKGHITVDMSTDESIKNAKFYCNTCHKEWDGFATVSDFEEINAMNQGDF